MATAAALALRVLWQGDVVGNRYDWSFTFYDWHRPLSSAIWAWDASGTGNAIGPNFGWLPNLLLAGLGSLLSLPVAPTLAVWLTSLLTLAGLGMIFLLRRRGFPWIIALLAGLLYALSPTILIRLIVGFASYIWAYALMPWWLTHWWHLQKTKHPRRVGLKAALLYAAATAQQQFAIMLLVVMVTDLLIDRQDRTMRRRKQWALAASVCLGLIIHLPWLWLSLQQGAGTLGALNEVGSSLGLISALPHDLTRTLLGIDHHVTVPLVDQLLPQRSFLLGGMLLLILSFLGVLTRRREARLAVIVLGLSWPLALGPTGVTATLYRWLYTTLPFTNLFREVYHWAALTALFTVIGAAYGWRWLGGKTRWQQVLAAAVMMGALGFIRPLPQSNFYGYLSPQPWATEYAGLHISGGEALDQGRAFFLPALGFLRQINSASLGAANTDIPALSTNRSQLPSHSSSLDIPEAVHGLRNAMLTAWYHLPESPTDATGYLQALGVKEVITRPQLESMFTATHALDTEREPLKKRWQRLDYDTLANQQPSLRLTEKQPRWSRYEVKDYPGIVSLVKDPVISAFDWTVANGGHDAVFYLEDLSDQQRAEVAPFPAQVEPADWMAAQWQPHNHLSDLRVDAAATPESGWSRPSSVWWRHAGLAQAREPYLYTTTSTKLEGSISLPPQEKYLVLVKLWHTPTESAISLTVNSATKRLPTTSGDNKSHFSWVNWGEITPDQPTTKIKIETENEAGLAQLLTIPVAAYRAGQEAWTSRSTGSYQAPQGTVSTHRTSPTSFNIKLATDRESWVIVREGYDARWLLRLEGHDYRPVRVNGYAMAFKVPGGTYEGRLIFSPQTTYSYLQGVALLAMVTVVILALGGLRPRRRDKRPIDLSVN